MTVAMGLHLRMEQVCAAKESSGPQFCLAVVRLLTRMRCWYRPSGFNQAGRKSPRVEPSFVEGSVEKEEP